MGMKRNARKPLMYINQPEMKSPKASMQQQYVSSRKDNKSSVKKHNTAPDQEKNPIKRPLGKYKSAKYDDETVEHEEEKRETIHEDEAREDKYKEKREDREDEDIDSRNRKPFKELNLEEKISYFVDAPSYAPRLKCEVKTEGKTYRGVLTDWEGEDVYIRTGNRKTSTKIAFSSIKNIRMLGF